jgi:hypothetical protein
MRNGLRIIRGQIPRGTQALDDPIHINCYNGNYRDNFRVLQVHFWFAENEVNHSSYPAEATQCLIGVTPISMVPNPDDATDPDVEGQIGWANLNTYNPQQLAIVAPDSIITQDLYVHSWTYAAGGGLTATTATMNYMIVLESWPESESEALLSAGRTNIFN